MEQLRLEGNKIFGSDPLKAAELYVRAMDLYENPALDDNAVVHSLDEYTKCAGNALTCLFKVRELGRCAALARRALAVNPIFAKANAFAGRCALEDASRLLSHAESGAVPLLYMCRAVYELPTMEESLRPHLTSAIDEMLKNMNAMEQCASAGNCEKVRVECRDGKGQGVVAGVSIAPFTVISDMQQPFSVAAYEETEGCGCCLRCGNAMTDATANLRCSLCGLAHYCSRTCYSSYTARHDDHECRYFLKLKEMRHMIGERQLDVPDEFYEIAAHCITTLSGLKTNTEGYERVLSLQSHTEEVMQSLHPIGSLLKDLFAGEEGIYNNVMGIVRCNALELCDPSGLGLGQALHGTSLTCLFNHSCTPNCAIDSARRTIVTTRPIAAGEELTISYIPQLYWPAKLRQQTLSEHYYFSCRCARCKAGEGDGFDQAMSMALPGARDQATSYYHVKVIAACTEVRGLPVEEIGEVQLKHILSLYEEVQQHLFSFHYLCHELRNTLSFIYAVLGRAAECLETCLAELLMWESIIPGALPVKQLKLQSAIHCCQENGISASTAASPLSHHMWKLAEVYKVVESEGGGTCSVIVSTSNHV